MTVRLLLLSFAIVLLAAILVAFDHNKAPNNEAEETTVIPLPGGAVGPESFAFDGCGGGPYTGVSDGRIIRWLANESRWVDFAVTSPKRDGCGENTQMEHICGRPLGLRFNKKTGDLYIADAYMGLLVVGSNGGLASPVSKEVNGAAFEFTNSLDIHENSGLVYFTDTSARFPRRNHIAVIITGDDTGRLLQFDPSTNKTTVLLNNLKFPNGVALSQNGDFLLFTETTTCRLYKYWLKTPKAGKQELVTQLPGFPDNIKRNINGEFWIGINSEKGRFTDWIISNPWVGRSLVRAIPLDITKLHSRLASLIGSTGTGIRVNGEGCVLDDGKGKRWEEVSEVEENEGYLWIGSVTRGFVVKQRFWGPQLN